MHQQYTLIRPIKLNALRLTLGFTQSLTAPINPKEIFKPTITHFEKLAVGRFFWFVVDLINWRHIFGGGSIENMTPLVTTDFEDGDPQHLHNITHPDDLPQVLAFSNFWVNFISSLPSERKPHVRMTLYFRIMNTQRNYYWIMVQYPDYIVDNNNKFVYGLVMVTDITHLKKDGRPMMSIMDSYDGSCQQFFCSDDDKLTDQNILKALSLRETEVLHYLTTGLSSKQIASLLNLSVKTIDNHRQNMLHKTSTKTSAELVNYCITMGYL